MTCKTIKIWVCFIYVTVKLKETRFLNYNNTIVEKILHFEIEKKYHNILFETIFFFFCCGLESKEEIP